MSGSREIKLGALISYAAIIFNVATGLLYTPWMIEQIGRADYGLFTLAGSFLAYFAMDFGFGNAIARFIAKYRAGHCEEKIQQLLGVAVMLFLFLDVVFLLVIVTLFFFIETVFVSLTPSEIARFRVVYCLVGGFSLVSFPFLPLSSILIGYEKFVFLKSCDLLKKAATVVFMVVMLLAGYGLYALVAVNALVGIGIIAAQCAYVLTNTPVRIDMFKFDRTLLADILRYSIWVTVILFAQRFFVNITPAILAVFCGTDEIAVFSIGMMIEAYFYSFAASLGGLFLAHVSRLVAAGDYASVTALMTRVGRMQLLVMGSIAAGLLTIGRQFIILWLGSEFASSYVVALLLVLPGLVTFSQHIAYTVLAVENRLRYHAVVLLCAAPISVGMSFLLSPRFGAVGAAFGICIALLTCSSVMTIVFCRVMQVDMLYFFTRCHLSLAPPFLLIVGLGFCINRWLPAVSLATFAPKAGILAAVIAVVLWTTALNAEEKQLALSAASRIPRIGRWFV